MATTLRKKLEQLPSARREEIEKRAAELVAEELTLSELRRALKSTQEEIAQVLEIDQANVSRLEKRSDLMLSTLRAYVRAMGGDLQLIAKFPNRPPVTLAGISDIIEEPEENSSSVPPALSS
ncbi:MAG: XRE family transcriptional regulator [Chroococcidiopsidaceae cyanobacterium CP_BM_ER_R8_30]|nr:XRE family transcriptional regulator [Chroococcidiopsidaceae cyanobacterium CP_BM_ER_R8_30]